MNILKENKKGDEKIISLFWFFLWIVITVGIAASLFVFSSYVSDTRYYEAKILAKQIFSCAIENGKLNNKLMTQESDPEINHHLLKSLCKINLEVNSTFQYHINLTLFDYESCSEGKCPQVYKPSQNNPQISISNSWGNRDLPIYCATKATGKTPQCYENKIYVLTQENNPAILEIKIAILKLNQNIK